MSDDPKPATKVKSSTKFWLTSLLTGAVIGFIAGVTGFDIGEAFSRLETAGRASGLLRIGSEGALNPITLTAAFFMIFMCVLQAVVLCVASISPSVSRKVGIEAQFGDGRRAQAAIWRLGASGPSTGFLSCYWSLQSVRLLLKALCR